MKRVLAGLILLGVTTVSNADYNWNISRVVDGDTVEVKVDFLPKELGNKLKIRIYGVDTPEKGGRAQCTKEADMGAAATKYTTQLVAAAKDKKVVVKEWDKFGGRVLGDVVLDGVSLRESLIKNGYAREYFGDKKKSWCE